MVVGVQLTGHRPVAACTWHSSDNLDIEAIHPSQQKMTKRQRTGSRLMAAGTWHGDLAPRASAKNYGCVTMTTMSMVVAGQQTNTYPQVISVQWTDFGRMAVLQQTISPRVVVNKTPPTTSVQQTDSSLIAMLERTTMSRVVARP